MKNAFKKVLLTLITLISIIITHAQSFKVHDKVQVKWGSVWYNAEIIEVGNNQYKIHYDGYGSNWDEWKSSQDIKGGNTNGYDRSTEQQTNGKYQIGQKVEALSTYWYKATVTGFGSGDLAGYIKVSFDDYPGTSDQYLRESSIRLPKVTANQNYNYNAGPRNGTYVILAYGVQHNSNLLGYFTLNNGNYTYYGVTKKPIGRGTYTYDAASKSVLWKNGPLTDYGTSSGFEIDREGKTHTIRLRYSTVGTNTTDNK